MCANRRAEEQRERWAEKFYPRISTCIHGSAAAAAASEAFPDSVMIGKTHKRRMHAGTRAGNIIAATVTASQSLAATADAHLTFRSPLSIRRRVCRDSLCVCVPLIRDAANAVLS